MKNIRYFFISLFGGIILFLLFLSGCIFWFGGIGQVIAYTNGESVYISPKTLNLGSFETGTKIVSIFHLTNLTSQEISVVGERSSCNCAFSETIPITVVSGKTVDLKINIHLPQDESNYDQTVTLMIAEPDRLAMHHVRIMATISNSLSKPVESQISNDAQ